MKTLLISIVLFASMLPALAQDERKPLEHDWDQVTENLTFQRAEAFIELGKKDIALSRLQEYLEIYHDGVYRDRAMGYMAAIYYERYRYMKAASIYSDLYEEFSTTDRGIEGYYRAGLCYRRMGKYGEAQRIFEQIVNEHPGSAQASRARLQMQVLELLKN